MGNSGELQRGWFPHNYVRSVNYVQPVLKKLKDNKDLDSITAANTAANVVMPSLTNLIQKVYKNQNAIVLQTQQEKLGGEFC